MLQNRTDRHVTGYTKNSIKRHKISSESYEMFKAISESRVLFYDSVANLPLRSALVLHANKKRTRVFFAIMGMFVCIYIEMFKLSVASAVYKRHYLLAQWKNSKGDVKQPSVANLS